MNQCEFFQDNQSDFVLPTILRGVSEENFFSCLFGNKQQNDEPMIVSQIEPIIPQKSIDIPNFNSYKRAKEGRRKEQGRLRKDYKKNICGYITKKIVRQFMAPIYKQKVLSLCDKYCCNYEECLSYYDKKIERITGPTHLDMLLNASKQDAHIKKCFKEFFIWFLRHRYLRYLMSEGKMDKKELYVDYKNKTLLYLGSIEEEFDQSTSFVQSQSKDTASIF